MHQDVQIARHAARQHDIIERRQALEIGLSPSGIKRRVDRGLWRTIHVGVYLVGGGAPGWEQRVMAATLACGPDAGASCASAGMIWELTDRMDEPHVVVPGATVRKRAGIVIHRSEVTDVVAYRGFRATNPMRTLLDLSAYLDEEQLEIALDAALRRRLVDVARLDGFLALARNARRRGSGTLRRLLSLRKPGRAIGSGGETVLFRLLRRTGLPVPATQHPVRTRSGLRFIDFAYPDAKVAIESDSWEYHSSRQAFDGERARRNELEELGWHVLQITSSDVRSAPVRAVTTIGTALGLMPCRWKRT
jgi:very-short-patch-repair endonuclease